MTVDHVTPKMKVLHLVHWPKSGITSFVRNLILAMDPNAFQQTVVTLLADEEELREFREQGIEAFGIASKKFVFSDALRLRRLIKSTSWSVIHAHSFQPGVWARIFSPGSRHVVTIHSCYDYVERSTFKLGLKAQLEQSSIEWTRSEVICVSDAVKQHLQKHTSMLPERLQVIRNGIDLEYFQQKSEARGSDGALKLVTVARLSPEKQLHVLLEAAARCLAQGVNLRIAIVGEGAERARLEALTDRLHLRDRIEFVGYKKDVRPWLWSADAYVCTSAIEGLPMSILEAQAAGLPVVATRVGGIPEVIEDGQTGFLLESGNVTQLVDCIVALSRNQEVRAAIASAAFDRVNAEFSMKNTANRYSQLYSRLVTARPFY